MAQGSDNSDTSYTKSPSPGNKQGSTDDVRKVMRREKNRIAAQKSRMRQTQKADSLHLEPPPHTHTHTPHKHTHTHTLFSDSIPSLSHSIPYMTNKNYKQIIYFFYFKINKVS
uniref:Basic leucine zipper transcriptional factor ATF-like n=1 Tax=Cyprinus carpio carpio TaxID=630221 RepID=A0A9J8AWN7_CYPCA